MESSTRFAQDILRVCLVSKPLVRKEEQKGSFVWMTVAFTSLFPTYTLDTRIGISKRFYETNEMIAISLE